MRITDTKITSQIGAWLLSGDTGLSSITIAAIALGATNKKILRFSAPYDPSDFGRCYRLVKAIPELVAYFPIICELVPEFAGIFQHWEELCHLYERDLDSGKSEELYQKIKTYRNHKDTQCTAPTL